MSEMIAILVLEKFACDRKLRYEASNGIDLISEDRKLLIGYTPNIEITNETITTAMEEFLNS